VSIGNYGGVSTDERSDEFTPEQEILFKRRYEEGYDMYIDADYIKCMKLNHPEVDIPIPSEQDSGSLLDSFPDIIPMSPTLIEYPEQERIDEAVSVHDNQLLQIPGATSSGPQLPITSEKQLPTDSEQQLQEQSTAGISPPLVNNEPPLLLPFPKGQFPKQGCLQVIKALLCLKKKRRLRKMHC